MTDTDGYAMDPDEAIEHVQAHVAAGDDEACDECPCEVSIRFGEALPSPADEDGLNSRVPASYQSSHLVMAYDDLAYDDWPDVLDRLHAVRHLAAALTDRAD